MKRLFSSFCQSQCLSTVFSFSPHVSGPAVRWQTDSSGAWFPPCFTLGFTAPALCLRCQEEQGTDLEKVSRTGCLVKEGGRWEREPDIVLMYRLLLRALVLDNYIYCLCPAVCLSDCLSVCVSACRSGCLSVLSKSLTCACRGLAKYHFRVLPGCVVTLEWSWIKVADRMKDFTFYLKF